MFKLNRIGSFKATVAIGVVAIMAFGNTSHARKDPQSAWVKLCDKTPLHRAKKGASGTETITKNICLTHHERLDGNTGLVIISAAIRKVEGDKRQTLMVMVPLGMALQPGVKAAVYTKKQWARAQKKEQVKDNELKPLSLKYSFCHAAGCTAEIDAPKALINSMKTGGGLMVLALNSTGRPVAFPIPLVGFKKAYNGKPIDNAKYTEARKQLMGQIRQRMRARIEAQKVPEPKKN
ncbi:MAG: invasion associated locus B family protein [Hyphomicrobiaceae bacterium]|nr:invasion associated locus B family protein [Hyphomicrobiaceae bacterium]